MRRIRLLVAAAAMMALSVVMAVPAMASVDYGDIRDDQAELIEQRLENQGYDVGDLDGEDLGRYWGIYDLGLYLLY